MLLVSLIGMLINIEPTNKNKRCARRVQLHQCVCVCFNEFQLTNSLREKKAGMRPATSVGSMENKTDV